MIETKAVLDEKKISDGRTKKTEATDATDRTVSSRNYFLVNSCNGGRKTWEVAVFKLQSTQNCTHLVVKLITCYYFFVLFVRNSVQACLTDTKGEPIIQLHMHLEMYKWRLHVFFFFSIVIFNIQNNFIKQYWFT